MPPEAAHRVTPTTSAARATPAFIDLGRMNYADAYAAQLDHLEEVLAAREAREASGETAIGEGGAGRVLFVEHAPPVITISRRPTARRHLIATDEQLRRAGVTIAETDRGGDITYHGPGQQVVYPILDLNLLGLRLHDYMRLLEQVVIDTCAHFGVQAERDCTATGVWVPHSHPVSPSKICALGVRIKRWISMHGLALNVTTDLDHFNLIVPCGLAGRSVTSLAQILGNACPTIEQVRAQLRANFTKSLTQRRRDAEKKDCVTGPVP